MRKAPQQARSRATTDALLDAAAHILGERGWSGLTTNRVAEAAGVSIGSLYQYFPDKLALIDAVRQRHFDDVLAVLDAASNPDRTRMQRVADLVDGMIAVHSRYPAAHRVLMEESPRGGDSQPARDHFDVACRQRYDTLFRVNVPDASGSTKRIGGQVLAGALSGAVHEAARQNQLASPVLRAELLALVDGYLSQARPATPARRPRAGKTGNAGNAGNADNADG
ncbi:TetR/AcrR family transcriptional regulator [Burkholderia paludis]|uniref:TetR/AcrR family transcriptional regulator n=1 Tax=Burkholderia paludis TaxID=1506587 RepID=UPI00068A102E|nr:TetR/AcrR family transcriptional regulator [Burkholderia paludis]